MHLFACGVLHTFLVYNAQVGWRLMINYGLSMYFQPRRQIRLLRKIIFIIFSLFNIDWRRACLWLLILLQILFRIHKSYFMDFYIFSFLLVDRRIIQIIFLERLISWRLIKFVCVRITFWPIIDCIRNPSGQNLSTDNIYISACYIFWRWRSRVKASIKIKSGQNRDENLVKVEVEDVGDVCELLGGGQFIMGWKWRKDHFRLCAGCVVTFFEKAEHVFDSIALAKFCTTFFQEILCELIHDYFIFKIREITQLGKVNIACFNSIALILESIRWLKHNLNLSLNIKRIKFLFICKFFRLNSILNMV